MNYANKIFPDMNIFTILVYNENKSNFTYYERHILKRGAFAMLAKEQPTSFLMEDIHKTKRDIETILLHLDYETNHDLIDSYTYQLKGAYMRYKFLLRQIQQEQNAS